MDMLKPLLVSVRVNVPFDRRDDLVDKTTSQMEPLSMQKNLTMALSFFRGTSHVMVVLAVLYAVWVNGFWQSSTESKKET